MDPEIEALKASYQEVVDDGGKISFVAGPFDLSEYSVVPISLGPFRIMMHKRYDSLSFCCRVLPLEEYGMPLADYIHPHVCRNGWLCLGLGKYSFDKAIREGRYVDAADIVCSVLGTYQHGHYVRIEKFAGAFCCDCSAPMTYNPDRFSSYQRCHICADTLCSKCTITVKDKEFGTIYKMCSKCAPKYKGPHYIII